jgi:hypothetical protein
VCVDSHRHLFSRRAIGLKFEVPGCMRKYLMPKKGTPCPHPMIHCMYTLTHSPPSLLSCRWKAKLGDGSKSVSSTNSEKGGRMIFS